MTKTPHIKYSAMAAVLALLALGLHRWRFAGAMAFVVGVSWELAETSVVGRHARLVPNAIG